ncbi:AAA family ATPase [Heyndrickxia coagulans]|uniref:AAA family ATPase n=1 Tax=Heyndrickxia coagulans TaxID=1398 RepID=UPI000779333E|nr:AAA family ATPase [Heyndrickxia coagulans]
MEYATMLLNKVIEQNDVSALARFNITEADMPTEAEKQAYRFIVDYAERNHGDAPSYATVVAEVPGFMDIPQVTDRYEYLAERIKDNSAKLELMRFITGKFTDDFNDGKEGKKLLTDLQSELDRIIINTNTGSKLGTDVKADGDKFLSEYDRRKEGESFRTWKSKFRMIPDYVSSNVYVVYGKSGRGKSVFTLEEAIECAMQGANVLIWAMEMGWYEVLVRIYVSLSARRGLLSTEIEGVNMDAGFNSSDLRAGKLPAEFDVAFRAFIDQLNEFLPGNITVRAVDDDDFYSRNLTALRADIERTKADVVVIDPFYYLDYERNTSKTAGGDAAATSMKLRRIAGQTHTVIFAITQAEETNEEKDDDGNRELALPERRDVKKTKQLLEDAYLLIGVDTDYKQGRGLIGLNKGRDGGEGEQAEILYIPSVGIVQDMPAGAEISTQFAEF